jgi:hypothetical protein
VPTKLQNYISDNFAAGVVIMVDTIPCPLTVKHRQGKLLKSDEKNTVLDTFHKFLQKCFDI